MVYIIVAIVAILLIVGLSIANFAGTQFEDTFAKYNKVPSYAKITGGQFALALKNNPAFREANINVVRTKGELTDAYSAKAKTVILSDSTCDNGSIAALAVVAHEFGHALQDFENNAKFIRNRSLAKITKIIGYFMLPILLGGVFVCFIMPETIYIGLSLIGASFIILFMGLALKVSTIRIESDASKKGLKILEDLETLEQEELVMAREVLKAALLTYIADFLRVILAWTMLTKKTKLFY